MRQVFFVESRAGLVYCHYKALSMNFRVYLSTLFLAAIHFTSFAQGDSTFLTHAATSLTKHFNTHPVEKVYLHLDKSYYLPGDTIWFKAYTVIGEKHQLSALSKVLYCELINNRDSVINREVLRLKTGMAWSDFYLPRSLKPGSYHIRAYTNWMRNAGTEYFYDQKIRIGGMQALLNSAKQVLQTKPDIQFFPEGGELVEGIRSRIAVKSVGVNGLGRDITGVITDNEGNEVATFATRHLGMGVFALMPQAGKTYRAKITCADSSKYTIDLPKARDEGFTLAINNRGADSIYVKVAANDKLFQAEQNAVFYLIAQSGGKIYYTAQSKLAGPVFTTLISKSRFPSGIVQFTLFSQNGEPLSERVIFIQNNDGLKVELSSSSNTYSTRQKVKIDISTIIGNTKAATGGFSVAVVNESRVPLDENSESTILNNLLLTSDIKGYIEQPNYYFTNINDQTRADLELLMLTQGYRRFDWKRILNKTDLPDIYQPEKSLELAGSIKTPGGKPVPNGKITLLATREKFIADTAADQNGNFLFKDVELPDTAKIVLRARKQNNGSNVSIYVKQQGFPAVIKDKTMGTDTTIKLSSEMLKNVAKYREQLRLDSIERGRELSGVTIMAKKLAKPDIYNGYGTDLERSVDMKRVGDYPSIFEAIKALVPGFRVAKIKIVIDGLELDDSSIASTYSADEIQSIRVVDEGGYDRIHGGNDKPGYIILTTKRFAGTDTTILKEIKIVAKKSIKKPEIVNSSNLNGAGNADQVIMGDKMEGCVTLSDCLQGKVFGVTFRNGTPYSIRAQGRLSGSLPMVIIIDGSQLDGSALNDLNANDVYSIEVLRSGAYLAVYGSNAPGGALVITTRRGGDPNYVTSITPSGLITYPFKGYTRVRRFYSPKYEGPKTDTQAPDLRSTIYWNPLVITDNNGQASFEYYNADTKGTYRVVVEGIDDNGNLGRQVYKYKVE
jgi:hypothetical protein